MIGDIINELRKDRNIPAKKLSEYLDVSINLVYEWEHNRCEPKIDTIIRLSKFFGVSVDYLLGLEDDFGGKVAGSNSPRAAVSTVEDVLTPEERKLIADYRKLDKVSKRAIERTASSLAEDSEDKVKQLFGESKR